ncbi:MAG TPA: GNAT family N-acetyltransferase [Streptosporangiaceae bacterium]
MAQPYPDHWEADVVLSDGGTAHLRPITPADAELLQEFHGRLSPETIYFRFFAPYPRLSARDIARFTTVDYDNRVALIATIGGEMIAVVRYDRITPDEAEVAFLVEDAHQGRGLASIMLEHLAAAAQERGVKRFIADTLPENRRMINVFREVGYTAQQRFDEGVIRLTLDLAPTDTFTEVLQAREHRAESRSIARLLTPASIAVIGAGRDRGSAGHTVLRHLLKSGFTGPVHPVNPAHRSVAGVRAYPTVADVPDDVDLAVITVPADTVATVVEQCAAKGVHALIVVSAGFGEAGPEGRERQDALVRTARAGGMRVVGPNCLGIANTDPDVAMNATLAPAAPPRGPVGFFSQSGALGIALMQHVTERGLGLSSFVSAGNRADVSGNDLLQYWEEDAATEVVLLYLESLGNPRKFTRLCRRISRSKPIVAVKSGGTMQGVPLGHAAQALTLPDHAVSELFAQAGVVRVDDISQMFDVAQLLAYQPLPGGARVAIVGNSDALGVLAEDACLRAGLEPHRPVDLGPGATAGELAAALSGLAADDTVDAVVAGFIPAVGAEIAPGHDGHAGRIAGSDDVAAAVRRSAAELARAGKPLVTTYLGLRGLPEELRVTDGGADPRRGSVPSYPTPEEAVRALSHAAAYAAYRRNPAGRPAALPGIDTEAARALIAGADVSAGALLGPDDTDRLLACYGVGVWPVIAVDSADAAEAAAERLGYPVVLKTVAPHLRHRADVFGVRPDLAHAAEVRRAYDLMVAELGPDAAPVVQRMARRGVPTSVTAGEYRTFGAVVSFGIAYPTTELLGDRAYRLAPLTDVDAAHMVRSVRAAPLLFGHRGTEAVAVSGLEDLLLRVSRLVDDLPEVARLELDPVVAGPDSVAVLDASVRLARPDGPRPDAGPRRLSA